MVTKLKTLLLREIKNPVLRSAVINFAIVVVVAAVTTLQGELTDGRVDIRIIVGTAIAAALKWAHSTATDLTNKAETKLVSIPTIKP